ncbi:adenosylcobinamide-phosphate synthase CbiB [Thermodesulfobacterium hydrogeniphilum]|uniref:adenosylcobinamide-phosphate synthase CbiB n=1 Tax=Thermodesulfobacterium hydrogeniphilum TaxID=161156 RepID=UPI000570F285|nr:adenosylcobinamide-phosphate synthase CbiB [Thermodesulfobacterium hydrogeniphilum]
MKVFYVNWWGVAGSLVGDLIIGDPKRFHPVCAIGKLIELTEKFLRTLINLGIKLGFSKAFLEKIGGVFLALVVYSATFSVSLVFICFLIKLCSFSFYGKIFSEIILILVASLFIALKGLIKAGKEVEDLVLISDLNSARDKLKALVGRDTERLSEKEIRIAIIESLGENLNDGIIAPLFYFIVGGFPFLVLYKTVNTLDSMVGYKNEKYLNFGWFSAKIDDLFNFLPARLAGISIILASAMLLGLKNAKRAFKIMLRDGRKHLSPNSGIPEAAIAGALGIRIGGPNYYEGVLVEKPYIGESISEVNHLKVLLAQKIVLLSSFIFTIFSLLLREFLKQFL